MRSHSSHELSTRAPWEEDDPRATVRLAPRASPAATRYRRRSKTHPPNHVVPGTCVSAGNHLLLVDCELAHRSTSSSPSSMAIRMRRRCEVGSVSRMSNDTTKNDEGSPTTSRPQRPPPRPGGAAARPSSTPRPGKWTVPQEARSFSVSYISNSAQPAAHDLRLQQQPRGILGLSPYGVCRPAARRVPFDGTLPAMPAKPSENEVLAPVSIPSARASGHRAEKKGDAKDGAKDGAEPNDAPVATGYKRDLESLCEFMGRWLWGSPSPVRATAAIAVDVSPHHAPGGPRPEARDPHLAGSGHWSRADQPARLGSIAYHNGGSAAFHHGRSRGFRKGTGTREVIREWEEDEHASFLTRGAWISGEGAHADPLAAGRHRRPFARHARAGC